MYSFLRDTPPQDPRSKLFYPAPLNPTHQRILDCIKRECKSSHDVDNDSSVISVNDEQETSDKLLEESKALNCGSPELCSASHETNNEQHDEVPEKNHQEDLQVQLNDNQVDHKPSPELIGSKCDMNTTPQNSEIAEQVSNTTPKKKSSELLEKNKSSPGTPPVNSKLFGRSPEQVGRSPEQVSRSPEQVGRSPEQVGRSPEQVGRLHDQACVSPVDTKDKGKQLEQDGKLLPRSIEQDIEKASLSLKLQINKLCQQQLYKKLELFNKSTEHQGNKIFEAVMTTNEDKPCGMSNSRKRNNLNNRCKKKPNKCIKLSMNRSVPAALPKCRSSTINLCLTNNAPSLTENRISLPRFSWLKSPSVFGLHTPLKYEAGLKRKLPPTVHSPTNVKRNCDETRGDFLTTLPASSLYSDIITELKRRSIGNFFIATSSSSSTPTKDWQSIHSIYHDHSYATDYVPINSTEGEGQSATVCDSCPEVPMLLCVNCNRCYHDWCVLQDSLCCGDCYNTDGVLPLV